MADFNIAPLGPFTFPSPAPLRLVPARFGRAVSGFSDPEAPDVDDHGFTVASSFGPGRGPTVGVMKNRTVRVKVIRDRLSTAAQLFVTSDDPAIAEIVHPADGVALNTADLPAAADGSAPLRRADCVHIRGASTQAATAQTIVKLRFGSNTGPVLAELGVRVYPILSIQVQAHGVTINGVASTTTLAIARQVFDRVNRIYAQAGLVFSLRGLVPETVNGFARAGTVTLTATNDQQNQELQTVLSQNQQRGALNAYFFPHYFDTTLPPGQQLDNTLGIAFSRDDARANPPAPPFPGCQPGITFSDQGADLAARSHTVAHEIGHALTLQHYNNGNGTGGSITDQREDIWAHRCLMHNIVGLVVPAGPATARYQSTAARIVVGYGSYADGTVATGQLLMNKKRPGVAQSEQVNLIRRAALANSFAPL